MSTVNERRADVGQQAVLEGGQETGVIYAEDAWTVVSDMLAYVAHFCDRLGFDPVGAFADGLESYRGDEEDGPWAAHTLDAAERFTP